jgi:gamma-glutamyl:cysteine ligase YbdK (ATP-grasp superfamily)
MSDATELPAPEIRILGGSPTPEEVAAITAVLQARLAELAAEQELLASGTPSAWQRSQRQLRVPLHNARGSWRSFSG